MQGSFRQGYTDLDFNHVLGTMISGSAEEERTTGDALAVVGDTAGPTGLYATFAGAAVLMALFGLVIVPLVRRRWTIQGLVLGVVTALVVGFGFCGVADALLDTPTGLFGIDTGGMTAVVMVCARWASACSARAATASSPARAGGRSATRTSPRRSRASPSSSPHSNSPKRGPNTAAWAPELSPSRSGGAARASSS